MSGITWLRKKPLGKRHNLPNEFSDETSSMASYDDVTNRKSSIVNLLVTEFQQTGDRIVKFADPERMFIANI